MTMETIIFLINNMLNYCSTVDLGHIVLKCKYRVHIEQLFDRKSLLSSEDMYCKINRNYPVTREVADQGAKLVISVVPPLYIII